MKKDRLESFSHYWNPLLMRVLSCYIDHPEAMLFGITGDIDNLGIYVAKNGRAKAENLVDLYNQIIRNEMVRWARENHEQLHDYTFVASGEEIIVLGVANHRAVVETLFGTIHPRINKLLRDNHYIDIGESGISFGCAILGDSDLMARISQMVGIVRHMTGEDEYVLYIDIMERIREILARELDKEKFRSLGHLEDGNEVLFRNFVFAHMLEYKYHTASALKVLSISLNDCEKSWDLSALRAVCGLDEKNRRIAFGLKKQIDEMNQ